MDTVTCGWEPRRLVFGESALVRVQVGRKTDHCPLGHTCAHACAYMGVQSVMTVCGRGQGSRKASLQKEGLKERAVLVRPGWVRGVPEGPVP